MHRFAAQHSLITKLGSEPIEESEDLLELLPVEDGFVQALKVESLPPAARERLFAMVASRQETPASTLRWMKGTPSLTVPASFSLKSDSPS